LLSSYLSLFKSPIDNEWVEPFWESSHGLIEFHKDCDDLMAPVRVEILIGCIWHYYSDMFKEALPELYETTVFILQDPYYQWKEVKDLRALYLQVAFSKSNLGTIPEWGGTEEHGYRIVGELEVTKMKNDSFMMEFFQDQLVKKTPTFQKLLPVLTKSFIDLVSAPVDDFWLGKLAKIRGIEQIVGFVRGLPSAMTKEQIEGTKFTSGPLNHVVSERFGLPWINKCAESSCFYCRHVEDWAEDIRQASTDKCFSILHLDGVSTAGRHF